MKARIVIDFQEDVAEIDALAKADPERISGAIVENSYLNLLTWFTVNERQFLRSASGPTSRWIVDRDGSALRGTNLPPPGPGCRLPVLAFSQALRAGLDTIASDRETTVTVPEGGVIRFRRMRVGVFLTGETRETATVSMEELVAAVDFFENRLRRYLNEQMPRLRDNPELRSWFAP